MRCSKGFCGGTAGLGLLEVQDQHWWVLLVDTQAGAEAGPSAASDAAEILPHKMLFMWPARCSLPRDNSAWCLP